MLLWRSFFRRKTQEFAGKMFYDTNDSIVGGEEGTEPGWMRE
jgi:hypothetical protein